MKKEQAQAIHNHARIMAAINHHVNVVREQCLHDGQKKIAKAYFLEGKRIIQCQLGRNGGKTETILYIAWVHACLNPGSHIYIICPERKQAKEIYWASDRLRKYGPEEFIAFPKESELRLEFKNGSFICTEGCENAPALRGIKPHLVFYDEFQDHTQEFDLEVMRPNLIAKRSSLIVMGTPPKAYCYYVKFRERLLDAIQRGDKTRFYLELPTECNPAIDKVELLKIKDEHIRNKEEFIWLREYEGKLIFGGEQAVFPIFHAKRKEIVRDAGLIKTLYERDRSKLEWHAVFDPGTTTCFAVLFAAINPYTSQIFVLDEIYETNRTKNSVGEIWPRVEAIIAKHYPFQAEWRLTCDEAEAWFINEVAQRYGVAISPTHKSSRDKDKDLSIIKDAMATGKLLIPDHSEKLIWEIENYATDEEGNLPKKHDHLVDDLRYLIAASAYNINEEVDEERQEELATDYALPRHRSLMQDYVEHRQQSDWTLGVETDSLEEEDDISWMYH